MSNLKKILPYLREQIMTIAKKADTNQDGSISPDEAIYFILQNPSSIMLIVFVVLGWLWNPLVAIYDSVIAGTFDPAMLSDLLLDVALPALFTLLFRFYSKQYISNESEMMKNILSKDKQIKVLEQSIVTLTHKHELELLKAQDECRIMQTALKTKDLEIDLLVQKLAKKVD